MEIEVPENLRFNEQATRNFVDQYRGARYVWAPHPKIKIEGRLVGYVRHHNCRVWPISLIFRFDGPTFKKISASEWAALYPSPLEKIQKRGTVFMDYDDHKGVYQYLFSLGDKSSLHK